MVTAWAFIFLFAMPFGFVMWGFITCLRDTSDARLEKLRRQDEEFRKSLTEQDKQWLDYHMNLAGVPTPPRDDIRNTTEEVE